MNTDLEQLLQEQLLEVPADFEQRILRLLPDQPAPLWNSTPAGSPTRDGQRLLHWLALAGGLAIGALQLTGFVFGLWTAAAVG